jgi:hypothetical protein
MAGSWPRVSREDRQNAFVLTNRSNGASCCGSSASAVSCASTAPFSGVRFRSSSAPSLERRPAMTTWIYRASRRAPRPLPFAVSLILQACTPRTRMQPQLATGALTGCRNRTPRRVRSVSVDRLSENLTSRPDRSRPAKCRSVPWSAADTSHVCPWAASPYPPLNPLSNGRLGFWRCCRE